MIVKCSEESIASVAKVVVLSMLSRAVELVDRVSTACPDDIVKVEVLVC